MGSKLRVSLSEEYFQISCFLCIQVQVLCFCYGEKIQMEIASNIRNIFKWKIKRMLVNCLKCIRI